MFLILRNHFLGTSHYVFCSKKIFFVSDSITDKLFIKATLDRKWEQKSNKKQISHYFIKKYIF